MREAASQRLPFVHEAELVLAALTDQAAPGAEVTRALCGHWKHEGSCRWPHNNAIQGDTTRARFRTLFIAPPAEEMEVRKRIELALRGKQGWSMVSCGPRPVLASEKPLAQRLRAGPAAS